MKLLFFNNICGIAAAMYREISLIIVNNNKMNLKKLVYIKIRQYTDILIMNNTICS